MAQLIKGQIKQTLATLNQFLLKLPKPKQLQYTTEVKAILTVKNAEDENTLKDVLKNLEYKHNFLKLTNPQIAKMIELEKANKLNGNGEKVVDTEVHSEESKSDSHFSVQSKEEEEFQLKAGKYVLKDGKLVEGEAPKRRHVEFSNWYASNVDPEDLKRHKELLDRQHFRGPMWDGQPKPKSIMDEQNPLTHFEDSEIEPEPNPALLKPKEDAFETVKR